MRLIDADALAIATDKYYDDVCAYDTWPNSDVSDTILAIEHIIDDMPTVDAEPVRHGRWEPMVVSSGRDSWKCSECGRRARGKLKNLPYCHCGAKMDGSAE